MHKIINCQDINKNLMDSILGNMVYKLHEIRNHPLFYLTTLGILLRYALGLYTSDSHDVEVWYRTGLSILYGAGVYDKMYFAYPPVWGYILGFFVKIGGLVFDPNSFATEVPELQSLSLMTGMVSTTITSPIFNFIFKTPLFIFDFLIGYVLYQFTYEITNSQEKAKKAFILWFFNPLVVTVSAIHGTFDAIPTFFTLLSIVHLYKKDYLFSGMALAVGILAKLYPLYFIPLIILIIFIYYYRSYQSLRRRVLNILTSILMFVVGCVIASILILLPFIIKGSFEGVLSVFRRLETGIVVGGVSPWVIKHLPGYEWISTWAYNNPTTVVKLTEAVKIMLLIPLLVTILMHGYRNYQKSVIYGSIAVLSIIYLTSPLVNYQYLVWIIPFLSLAVIDSNFSKFKFGKIFHCILINLFLFIISLLLFNYYLLLFSVIVVIITSLLLFPKPCITLSYVIITICGLFTYFSLMGIWSLFMPLGVYTNILTVDTICKYIINFWSWHGLLTQFIRNDIKIISATVGIYGLILAYVHSIITIFKSKIKN